MLDASAFCGEQGVARIRDWPVMGLVSCAARYALLQVKGVEEAEPDELEKASDDAFKKLEAQLST